MSESEATERLLGPEIVVRQRIRSLDVLRGFATLGILAINVVGFSLPYAIFDPTNSGGNTGTDLWTFIFMDVFFEGSMRATFCMLFGASCLLILSERQNRQLEPADLHYRRISWLLAFGFVHAYLLLWPGEILYTYAIAGLFLYPLRVLSPRALLVGGIACIAFLTLGNSYHLYSEVRVERAAAVELRAVTVAPEKSGITAPNTNSPLKRWNQWLSENHPPQATIAEMTATMQGGYFHIFKSLIPLNRYIQSTDLYHRGFLDAIGLMLIGMALLKLNVLTGARSAAFYATLMVAGYAVGFTLKSAKILALLGTGFDPIGHAEGDVFNELARLGIALGHVAAIICLTRTAWFSRVAESLANVGRMALSNYIAQTLICVTLFYGFGFGLYGQLARHQLVWVVLGIWTVQLLCSSWWLRHFRYGPLEWAWRSLTYWRRQPFAL